MTVCESCSAPIDWVETKTGRRMPLNPEPVTIAVGEWHGGRSHVSGVAYVVVVDDAGATHRGLRPDHPAVLHSEGLGLDPLPRVTGRVSHFATCPDAARFRKHKVTR